MFFLQGNIDISIFDKGGTGDLLAYPFLCLLISFFTLTIIRRKSKQSLIQKYHEGVTESTANGKTSVFLNILIFIVGLFFTLGSVTRSVSVTDNLVSINLCYFPNLALSKMWRVHHLL